MKRMILPAMFMGALLTGAVCLSPTMVEAQGKSMPAAPTPTKSLEQARERVQALQERLQHNQPPARQYGRDWNQGVQGANPAAVPELDPNAAGAAMILLAGGMLVMLDRRRHVAR